MTAAAHPSLEANVEPFLAKSVYVRDGRVGIRMRKKEGEARRRWGQYTVQRTGSGVSSPTIYC